MVEKAKQLLSIGQSSFTEIFIIFVFAFSQVSMWNNPQVGVYTTTLSIMAFVVGALIHKKLRKLFIALSIFLVAQHAAVSFHTQDAFLNSSILYAVILLLAFAYRYLFFVRNSAKTSIKARMYVLFLPLMTTIGAGLGFVGYVATKNVGLSFASTPSALLLLSLPVWAFAEEMLFRGLIEDQALKSLRSEFALVTSAGVYALAFLPAGTTAFWLALLSGMVLTATYNKEHNLVLNTAINTVSKLTVVSLAMYFAWQ